MIAPIDFAATAASALRQVVSIVHATVVPCGDDGGEQACQQHFLTHLPAFDIVTTCAKAMVDDRVCCAQALKVLSCVELPDDEDTLSRARFVWWS